MSARQRNEQLRKTTLIEMVETHNIARSIARLQQSPYNPERWRRALYHALLMGDGPDKETATKIRDALRLP